MDFGCNYSDLADYKAELIAAQGSRSKLKNSLNCDWSDTLELQIGSEFENRQVRKKA